jgi:REP element-mobilizing transposase RayT
LPAETNTGVACGDFTKNPTQTNKTMSYTKLLYHAVFCTKYRRDTIPEAHEKELYAYIMRMIDSRKSKLYRIGGTENHLHLLFDMHPTFALSNFMRDIKENSSRWLRKNPNFPDFEGWGVSFAAFTYNLSDKQTVSRYIAHQKEHHKTTCFEDEYRNFVTVNGVEIDENYFLKD